MPLKGNFGIGMNLECGNIVLYGIFYQPIKESSQKLLEEYEKPETTSEKEIPETTPAKNEKENCIYITKPEDKTAWDVWEKDWKKVQELNPEINLEKNFKPGLELKVPYDWCN